MASDRETLSGYSVRTVGAPYTLEHRVYIEKDGTPVSPFHDIPLYANDDHTILNMIVEIPRWTNAKMEISRNEFLNPIKQDVKDAKPRFVKNCFPYKGYIWNYGALPQTWENPGHIHPDTKAKGDNDPLDACEIGQSVAKTGELKQVKVLGVMALLDGGETDWKIIVIDVNDPLASKLNDIEDVEEHCPGLLEATRDLFRIYKIPDGKPPNEWALSGQCKNKSYANEVIQECAGAWKGLISDKLPRDEISISNRTVPYSPGLVGPSEVKIPDGESIAPALVDPDFDKYYFVSSKF